MATFNVTRYVQVYKPTSYTCNLVWLDGMNINLWGDVLIFMIFL